MHLDWINKKAQGRSFWIIVTAVMALVVLVILLVIFTNKTGDASEGFLECTSKGGFCVNCDKETSTCGQICQSECETKNFEDCSYTSIFTCPENQGCCLSSGSKLVNQ